MRATRLSPSTLFLIVVFVAIIAAPLAAMAAEGDAAGFANGTIAPAPMVGGGTDTFEALSAPVDAPFVGAARAGEIPAVPEPQSWALTLAGLMVVVRLASRVRRSDDERQ